MEYQIIGSVWYTGMQFGGQIGFVAIKSGPDLDKWKCYAGIGFGGDEQRDAMMIAGQGAKVTKEVACAHFPAQDPDKFVY
jgi:hypothetical protein